MKNIVVLIVFVCTVLSISACRNSERSTVAVVNGKSITVDDFRNELRIYHLVGTSLENQNNSERFFEIKKEILNSMIKELILIGEAEKLGMKATEAELSSRIASVRKDYPGDSLPKFFIENEINYNYWKNKIKNSIIIEKLTDAVTKEIPKISENEINDYYVKNKSRFTVPQQVRAYQIVVKKEEDAYKIYNKLRKNKEFEELAKEYSITPESGRGGDMGYFSKGSMPKAFDNALFNLGKGRISKVVKSDFGYHIFKVTDKKPTRLKPLEEVRDEIIRELSNIKRDEIFSDWLKAKITDSKIERNHGLLANIK